MKKGAWLVAVTILSGVLSCGAAPSVAFDAAKRSVTFTAVSTDCGLDMQVEFLFVGPGSDHDYEAMFVTDASIADIADAFKKAGIPSGKDIDGSACRFWPVGETLTIEPAITNLIREMHGGVIPPIAFTGGTRDGKGIPEADTNSPCAVLALYNCSQSLMQFNDALDQSETYGRFQPAVKIPKGERRTFTFTWDGTSSYDSLVIPLKPGKMGEALTTLKEKSAAKELDVICDFASDLTLRQATDYATALSMVDSVRVKINGSAKGQFFYRAFLPLEKWRDRKERLAQPPEVHLKGDGSSEVVEITEDWSDSESLDPKLTVTTHQCKTDAEAAALAGRLGAKSYTVFFYAPPETRLERLHAMRKSISTDIRNWYIFTE